ncbi:MAG: hypothetical protein HY815_10605 [Candidatus Riflebacteria bacterium]|nr:hypothetical protein [Candidatus Riflebacteria bacterium]
MIRAMSAVLLLSLARIGEAGPSLVYHLRHVRAPGSIDWHVAVQVTGLDPAVRDVLWELPSWGDWSDLGDRYFHDARGEPPIRRVASTPSLLDVDLPPRWDGTLVLRYRLRLAGPGSPEFRSHPLIPFATDRMALGFTNNTLALPLVSGARLSLPRRLLIEAPRGWTVTTGFGSPSTDRADLRLPEEPPAGVVALGRPVEVGRTVTRAGALEVVQFGRPPPVASTLLEGTSRLMELYAGSTGWSPFESSAARVVATDARTFGTAAQHGIHVSLPDLGLDRGISEPRWRHVAHELFHAWLGWGLQVEGPLEWFKEGVAEYVALRSIVALGLASPVWFALAMDQKLREVADEPLARTVPFLGAEVAWRSRPELESLMYAKGCVLAFHLDVRLRRRGHPGIARLVGDLRTRAIGRGGALAVDPSDLKLALNAAGLEETVRRHLEGVALPDLDQDLGSAGFFVRHEATDLTYLGVGLQGGALLFGTVDRLDRSGPAARAGLCPGDRIFGIAPLRSAPAARDSPALRAAGVEPLGYGMRLFRPGLPVTLDVLRGGQKRRIVVTPRLVPGGTVRTVRPRAPLVRRFFAR